jgi:chromosome segregation ATPase
LDNRHSTKDIQDLQNKVLDLQKEDEGQKARLSILEGKVESIINTQHSLSLSLIDTQAVLDDYQSFKFASIEAFASIKAFKEKVEIFEKQVHESLTQNDKDHLELQAFIDELFQAIDKSNGDIEALKASVAQIDSKYSSITSDLQKQIEVNNEAISGLQKMQSEFVKCFTYSTPDVDHSASPIWCEKLHSTLKDYSDKLNTLKVGLEDANKERANGDLALLAQIETLNTQVKEVFTRLDLLNQEILKINLDLSKINQDISEATSVLNELMAKTEQNKNAIAEQKQKIDALTKTLNDTQASLNAKVDQQRRETEEVFKQFAISSFNKGFTFNFRPVVVTVNTNTLIFNSIEDYRYHKSGFDYGTHTIFIDHLGFHSYNKDYVIPVRTLSYTFKQEPAPEWVKKLIGRDTLPTVCENANRFLCINAFNTWLGK